MKRYIVETDLATWAVREALGRYGSATTVREIPAPTTVERGLRRRIHLLERHNQHFERCESAWCNPSEDNDPAKELGTPEAWPAIDTDAQHAEAQGL